ncbi:hypothetical protein M2271_001339 [Streptomyces sp. LBL]|uniref:hypothetical protein n=1 Tax=Streptomyces sp. LBL TaxID=2940562 RepID=UPI0024756103|nr:hypothetical protein [Streptomyces sp. LBL]MDH6623552.1 hypothetical protein [Streptomyces sp. LBL]
MVSGYPTTFNAGGEALVLGLQLDVEPFHVGELHAQPVRAAVVGAEIHLREAVGRDLLVLLLVGALLTGGEQAVGPLGRQGLG